MNSNTKANDYQSGIYQIRNLVNDKVYVGQSRNIKNRKTQHRRELIDGKHYNKHLQRSLKKHGLDKFVFEVIEYCPEDVLNDRERYWIKRRGSEYADRGYNMAYAYTLFKEYDKNREINKSKRKPNTFEYTEDIKTKFQKSIAMYWENDNNRIKHSIATSKIEIDKAKEIKRMLHDDLSLSCNQIAEQLGVSLATVTHIQNLKSHTYLLPEYNFIIDNKNKILDKKMNRLALRMYRNGEPYSVIGERLGVHHRTAIRRIDRIKTNHDDRCRLNVINRSATKRHSQIKTMINMGYTGVAISRLLGCSRDAVREAKETSEPKNFDTLNEARGKVSPFKYSDYIKEHSR